MVTTSLIACDIVALGFLAILRAKSSNPLFVCSFPTNNSTDSTYKPTSEKSRYCYYNIFMWTLLGGGAFLMF